MKQLPLFAIALLVAGALVAPTVSAQVVSRPSTPVSPSAPVARPTSVGGGTAGPSTSPSFPDLRGTPILRTPDLSRLPDVRVMPPPPRASGPGDGGDDGDSDGDGYTSSDCNDYDATVHPGAPEVYNGRDDNCDGAAY